MAASVSRHGCVVGGSAAVGQSEAITAPLMLGDDLSGIWCVCSNDPTHWHDPGLHLAAIFIAIHRMKVNRRIFESLETNHLRKLLPQGPANQDAAVTGCRVAPLALCVMVS